MNAQLTARSQVPVQQLLDINTGEPIAWFPTGFYSQVVQAIHQLPEATIDCFLKALVPEYNYQGSIDQKRNEILMRVGLYTWSDLQTLAARMR